MNTLYFNGHSLELKENAFYISGNENDVCINVVSSPTSYAFKTENGAAFWISDGQLYINSVLTDVFINKKAHFRGLPIHVSNNFRDYCEDALRKNNLTLKKENPSEKNTATDFYSIACFQQDDIHFEIRMPVERKDPYVVCFYLKKSLNQEEITEFKNIANSNHFKDFSINTGGTIAITKTDTFNINDLYHVLSFVHDVLEDDDKIKDTNCIA